MSNAPHPVALTTAYLMEADTRKQEHAMPSYMVADLASRIHRCGMAIRRAASAGNYDKLRKAVQRTGTHPDAAKLAKVMQRADDWRLSLNVDLEPFHCKLESGSGCLIMHVPGRLHPHPIA